MPRIPQPLSDASILTGGINVSAPASAFGAAEGGQSIASAIDQLGRGLALNNKTRRAIEERDKRKNDELWASKAASEFGRNLTDFEVNPENRSRVDYLPAYLENVDQNTQAFIEKAPSPEAEAMFHERARGMVDARYGRVASLGAENELKAEAIALDDTWGNFLQSYHSTAPIDPHGAAGDLIGGLDQTIQSIQDLYSDVAPEMSKQLIAKRIEDTVLALSDKSPNVARDILDNSSIYLDESKRQVLINKLEARKQETSLLLKEDFNSTRESLLIQSERDGLISELPIEDYQAVYQGEQAQVMKKRDDAIIGANVNMHALKIDLRGKNPAEKAKQAEAVYKTLNTQEEQRAFASIIAPYLQEDARLFATDSSAWQDANNPILETLQKDAAELEVNETMGIAVDGGPGVLPPREDIEGGSVAQGATKEVAGVRDVPTPDQAAASREQYYRAKLRYQGLAPEGDTSGLYMNLPRSEQHILTKAEANRFAAQINGADIDNAIGTIQAILQRYPSDDLRAQVIHDLTTLPQEKLNPVYAIAFQNAGESWLPTFIGNVRSVKDLEAMSEVDKASLRKAVQSNGTWASFFKSVMGPQNQRSGEVEGYYNAIEMNARAFMAQGMTAKAAAEASINQLLTSTMKPVEVQRAGVMDTVKPDGFTIAVDDGFWGPKPYYWRDDPQLWLPRQPQGWDRKLSDEELDNLGQRMGVAIANINPDDVDLSQFSWASQVSANNKYRQQQLIHTKIVQTGQFYPEPGGAYYRLTVEGEVPGSRIDLRNKNGEFFRLPLAKLPAYTRMVKGHPSGLRMKGLMPDTWEWKEVPEFIDYPMDDLNENGFPNTGKFWEFVR